MENIDTDELRHVEPLPADPLLIRYYGNLIDDGRLTKMTGG